MIGADRMGGISAVAQPGGASGWPDLDLNGDIRAVARYVDPAAIANTRLHRTSRPVLQGGGAQSRAAQVDDAVDWVLRVLADCQINYVDPPIGAGRDIQRIRHPQWVLPDQEGTCIDLVVLAASALMAQHVRPLIAMIDEPGSVHALLGVLDKKLDSPLSTDEQTCEGMLVPGQGADLSPSEDLQMWVELELRRITWVDVVATCVDRVDDPRQGGQDRLSAALGRGPGAVRLLDVAGLHRLPSHLPHQMPSGGHRELITSHLPPVPDDLLDYPSRHGALDDLVRRSGTVILQGDHGIGKSLLARRAAVRVAEGIGWVIRADDAEQATLSLAQRSPASQRSQGELQDPGQVRELADLVRSRLQAAMARRWVIVADNADLAGVDAAQEVHAAKKLLAALPTPDADRGDLLLLTSTHPVWHQLAADDPSLAVVAIGSLTAEDRAAHHQGLPGWAATTPLHARSWDRLASTAPEHAPGDDVQGDAAGAFVDAALAALVALDGEAPRAAFELSLAPDEALIRDRTHAQALTQVGLVEAYGDRLRMHGTYRQHIRDRLAQHHADVLLSADLRGHSGLDRSDLTLADLTWWADTVTHQVTHEDGSASGRRLVELATAAETLGSVDVPLRWMAVALPLLDPDRPEDELARAAALHLLARPVNQESDPPSSRLQTAIAQATEAEQLRASHAARLRDVAARDAGEDAEQMRAEPPTEALQEASATEALQEASRSLRLMLQAKTPAAAVDITVLRQITDELEDSASIRSDRLGPHHFLTLRGLFNPARLALRLALAEFTAHGAVQADPFDRARAIYATVADRRRDSGGPHLAACLHGMAIADYNAAVYATAPADADDTRRWRQQRLLRAASTANNALEIRVEAGRPSDISKSLELLHKIHSGLRITDMHVVGQAEHELRLLTTHLS